jgi:predicted HTH domain antitoxin
MPVSVTIEVPEDAFSVLRRSPEEFGEELKLAAICKWYEIGRLSQSKAAALAGLSRHDFLLLLGRYGVTPFQTTAEELEAEMARE